MDTRTKIAIKNINLRYFRMLNGICISDYSVNEYRKITKFLRSRNITEIRGFSYTLGNDRDLLGYFTSSLCDIAIHDEQIVDELIDFLDTFPKRNAVLLTNNTYKNEIAKIIRKANPRQIKNYIFYCEDFLSEESKILLKLMI